MEKTKPDELPGEEEEIPSKKRRRILVTDEEGENFIDELLRDYPGLVERSQHWSLTLIGVIVRIDYTPPRHLCRLGKPYPPTSALAIVQRHLTPDMLNDIRRAVERWVSSHEDAITMPGVEGGVVISTSDTYAYLREETPTETDAASIKSENWGSW